MRETCSFACEIDLTDFLTEAGGGVQLVQSEGTFRLRLQTNKGIQVEESDKPGEPKTKIHRFRIKR